MGGVMISAEDCRNKAIGYRRTAQLTADPDASLGWLELSDAWLALAEQIVELDSLERPQSVAGPKRPVEMAERRRIATLKVADRLRERLALPSWPEGNG